MARKKILVIDGDISLSEELADRLQEENFQASAVSSGEKALDILRDEWMDLVILSIKMQGEMDGFQVMKTIKADKDLCEIPIIMESDKPGMKDVFKELGVAYFFVKPYHSSDLVGKVKELLA